MNTEYEVRYIPITVPKGPYCWQRDSFQSAVCEHFDNEGGAPVCKMGLNDGFFLEDDGSGVLKASGCVRSGGD